MSPGLADHLIPCQFPISLGRKLAKDELTVGIQGKDSIAVPDPYQACLRITPLGSQLVLVSPKDFARLELEAG